jgi:hypothetical protein
MLNCQMLKSTIVYDYVHPAKNEVFKIHKSTQFKPTRKRVKFEDVVFKADKLSDLQVEFSFDDHS